MSKSCGCKSIEYMLLNKNKQPKVIPINTKINKLTVISEPFKKKENDSHYYVTCQCECGNIIDVRTSILLKNNIISCGCTKSKGELFIKNLLQQNNVKFYQEYKFEDLWGKVFQLRFDFAIEKNNQIILLIEFNGEQHYKECGGYYSGKYETIQKYDNKKIEYCKQHNIPLLILSYRMTQEEIKKEIVDALNK